MSCVCALDALITTFYIQPYSVTQEILLHHPLIITLSSFSLLFSCLIIPLALDLKLFLHPVISLAHYFLISLFLHFIFLFSLL